MSAAREQDLAFIQFYEEKENRLGRTGIDFALQELGGEIPRAGDCFLLPERKADFEPRDPENHLAHDVLRRYFVPDKTKQQANIIKVMVARRKLTASERELLSR